MGLTTDGLQQSFAAVSHPSYAYIAYPDSNCSAPDALILVDTKALVQWAVYGQRLNSSNQLESVLYYPSRSPTATDWRRDGYLYWKAPWDPWSGCSPAYQNGGYFVEPAAVGLDVMLTPPFRLDP